MYLFESQLIFLGPLLVSLVSKCLAEKESQALNSAKNENQNEIKVETDLVSAPSAPSLQTLDLVAAEGKHYHKEHKKWKKKGGKHGGGDHGHHSKGKWGGGYKHAGHNYKKHHKHGGYVFFNCFE